jgi:hypothetical protein
MPDMVPLKASTSDEEPVGFPFESRASTQQSMVEPVTVEPSQKISDVAASIPPEETLTLVLGRRRDLALFLVNLLL